MPTVSPPLQGEFLFNAEPGKRVARSSETSAGIVHTLEDYSGRINDFVDDGVSATHSIINEAVARYAQLAIRIAHNYICGVKAIPPTFRKAPEPVS